MPFVVFEGGEGVGKSTQLGRLAQRLRERGEQVVMTREPGGTPFAEGLRALFKDDALRHDEPTPWTELLVVAAARAQHLAKVIRPLRSATGRAPWILCDRFLDSAIVYQGFRGALGADTVLTLHRLFMSEADLPDVTLVLDCDPQAALARVQGRVITAETRATGHAAVQPPEPVVKGDRLDGMKPELHVELREGFLRLVREKIPYPCGREPRRHLIDAALPADGVAAQIEQAMQDVLP